MAKKISLLVDTDICIDYLNHQIFRDFFESREFIIYYSAVTKKELLAKEGLSDTEEKAIRKFLKHYRMIPLNQSILEKYSCLRKQFPSCGKEDCLIASTAIVKKLSLVTRNDKHYRIFPEINLYFNQQRKA